MKRIICLVLVIFSAPLSAASFVPVSGQHYRILEKEPAHISKTGVTELFWYGCDYCRQFHYASGVLRKQYAELEWHYLPTVLRPEWRRHAKLYYLIADQPQFDMLHEGLYERLVEEPGAFTTDDDLQAWLQMYGVEEPDLTARLKDYRLNAQLKQDLETLDSISLRGVPALIIAGRYLLDASMVSDMGQYMATLNHLLQFVPVPSKEKTSSLSANSL